MVLPMTGIYGGEVVGKTTGGRGRRLFPTVTSPHVGLWKRIFLLHAKRYGMPSVGRRIRRSQSGITGPQLIHWRWPKLYLTLEGCLPYVLAELPQSKQRVRPPCKEHQDIIYSKIHKYVSRGYVTLTHARFIRNFIDYFGASKGPDNIRFVLNGTSCGLSAAVWASTYGSRRPRQLQDCRPTITNQWMWT